MPPTLGQVRESFPLPGRYHFRFKSPLIPGTDRDKGGMAVWMDCVHDSQMIPSWKGTIVAKVTRVAVDDDEDDDDDDFGRPVPVAAPTQQRAAPTAASGPSHPPPRHMGSSEPLLDVFDQPMSVGGGAAPGSTHGSTASHHSNTSADLFNTAAPPVPSNGGSTLLDMDGPMYHGHQHHGDATTMSSAHHDFFGMTAPVTPAQPPPPAAYGGQAAAQQQQPRPNPQQKQQQQQRPPQQAPRSGNAFDSFSSTADPGPFGGLEW